MHIYLLSVMYTEKSAVSAELASDSKDILAKSAVNAAGMEEKARLGAHTYIRLGQARDGGGSEHGAGMSWSEKTPTSEAEVGDGERARTSAHTATKGWRRWWRSGPGPSNPSIGARESSRS